MAYEALRGFRVGTLFARRTCWVFMPALWLVVAITISLLAVAAGIIVRRLLRAGFRYRNGQIVVCPETSRPAGVRVDVPYAIATSLIGEPKLRLAGCSRWPERGSCGQQCLSQVQSAPRACVARNLLRNWYEDKCCVWCGAPLSPVHWTGGTPVLLVGKVLKQWNEIPVIELPEALAAAKPVCFPCYARQITAREVRHSVSPTS
jgi:hypothetical protein